MKKLLIGFLFLFGCCPCKDTYKEPNSNFVAKIWCTPFIDKKKYKDPREYNMDIYLNTPIEIQRARSIFMGKEYYSVQKEDFQYQECESITLYPLDKDEK